MPPFGKLDSTHIELMRHLEALGALTARVYTHGVDATARAVARELLDYFSRTARAHHEEEERFVFPALLDDADPELSQLVRRLQQDHGWLEQDWLELAPQLQGIAEGYGGWDPDELRHGVRVFRALYGEHIALEESIVYPEAKRRALAALA